MRKSGSTKFGSRRVMLVAAMLASSPAMARDGATDAYRDDRSTATAVIASLYNAINRHEYLRAWSYFAHDEDPDGRQTLISEYDAFALGYRDTVNVELLIGPETAEGAAGSTYFTVPVAIDALSSDGSHGQFAGCYTLRLAQPAVQAVPPFQPLHIESAHLEPVDGELEDILPESCAPG